MLEKRRRFERLSAMVGNQFRCRKDAEFRLMMGVSKICGETEAKTVANSGKDTLLLFRMIASIYQSHSVVYGFLGLIPCQ